MKLTYKKYIFLNKYQKYRMKITHFTNMLKNVTFSNGSKRGVMATCIVIHPKAVFVITYTYLIKTMYDFFL